MAKEITHMKNKKKNTAASDSSEATMSLSGHLKELRNRIIVTLIAFVIVFCLCLSKAQDLVSFFTDIGDRYGYQFVYISPQELLMEYFTVSMIISLVFCIPVIAWQIWRFVQPGLKKNENTAFAFALIFGMIFFCLGVLFAYCISLPYILEFLIKVSKGSDIQAQISVQNYIGFLLTVFLVFGCVFELPIISVILTALGLIKSTWLRKGRKYAIIISFVLAAIVTPPDIVSQIMVALPMIVLFQLGIFLSILVEKLKKKKKEDKEESDEE